MTGKTYTISSLSDMLKVPSEKRRAMLQQLELALSLAEFAHCDAEVPPNIDGFQWSDDGDQSVHMVDSAGAQPWLSLKVTEGPMQ